MPLGRTAALFPIRLIRQAFASPLHELDRTILGFENPVPVDHAPMAIQMAMLGLEETQNSL